MAIDILLAESAGFCFGVKRAVDETLKIQKKYNKRIYTLGPLIHNNDVVKYLEENNIFSISLEEAEKLAKDEVVVIRSHGVSKEIIDKLTEQGLNVINATCPYVSNIQKKVNKYSGEGYNIVILGDKNHPEVVGINGWCDNRALITSDGNFDTKLPNKICVVSQTTERQDNWQNTISSVSKSAKEFLAFNTICSATEVRQKSAYELSKEVDVMIVIGGKSSSNTTKLYQICSENCKNTFHIENEKELDINMLKELKHERIGLTAGASTPDWIIQNVTETLKNNL